MSIDTEQFKQKSFWQKPEGVTGALFLGGALIGIGYVVYAFGAAILAALGTAIGIAVSLIVLAAIVYMVLDPKMRGLVGYMYKSVMRAITGMFVTIDPIGILKNYVDDMKSNLRKLSKQISAIRGQMRKLKSLVEENSREINNSMKMASLAKQKGNNNQVMLNSRKAARLKESNQKYTTLYNKMEVMYRILSKMYQNSEILIADTEDQVKVKEQERKAIRASHGAMKSAMSIISGDPDKRAMFDMAIEAINDDVSNKVGEMERFMEMSANFMESVDLQNGVFEEEGLKMLEKWEKESNLLLMGGTDASTGTLDLNSNYETPEKQTRTNDNTSYDQLFD